MKKKEIIKEKLCEIKKTQWIPVRGQHFRTCGGKGASCSVRKLLCMCCKLTASHDHYLEIGATPDDQVLSRSGLLQISANIDLQDLLWILSIVGFVLSPPLIHTGGGQSEADTSAQGMGGREEKWEEENNLWLMQRPKEIAFCELQGPAGGVEPLMAVVPLPELSLHPCSPWPEDELWLQPWQVSEPFICMWWAENMQLFL